MDYQPGDRVAVNISAGLLPGSHPEPQWEIGTVEERLPTGLYRVRLDGAVAGRPAVKEALPEHMEPAASSAAGSAP